jgi:Arm domain-containing DNA-binding protein/integrase-like protein
MDNLRIDMALTDLQLRNLKPKPQPYLLTDARGLALEVLSSGTACWRYRYQLNGKTEKVTLGRYPVLGLKEARLKRDELAAAVFRGESPARQKQLEKVALANSTSVRDFCERYFKEVIERTWKDPIQLRRYLEKEIYPSFGSQQMKDVTAQDVQRLVFRKRDNGFESAAAQIRNLLKRVFDYGIVCGLVSVNPVHATPMRFITRARPRTRALSPRLRAAHPEIPSESRWRFCRRHPDGVRRRTPGAKLPGHQVKGLLLAFSLKEDPHLTGAWPAGHCVAHDGIRIGIFPRTLL